MGNLINFFRRNNNEDETIGKVIRPHMRTTPDKETVKTKMLSDDIAAIVRAGVQEGIPPELISAVLCQMAIDAASLSFLDRPADELVVSQTKLKEFLASKILGTI